MLDWTQIDTVLLDMDGTLLDLHFDNHFWLDHLPLRYAQQNNIPVEAARQQLMQRYTELQGQLQWYCLDHWQQALQMDIVALKREVQHKIHLRADAKRFLQALRQAGKQVVLVTNAHRDSLSLKVERTALDQYFDQMISAHDIGAAKESQALWRGLQQRLNFDLQRTLFIDDSEPVLRSAQRFGIRHLLAVANPDSKKPEKIIPGFTHIHDYDQLSESLASR